MTITPFLTLKLRGKKDALLARQRARRVARLLCFNEHEQACIAAGVFVIACQALTHTGSARLSFQIDNRQLQVLVDTAKDSAQTPRAGDENPAGPSPAPRTGADSTNSRLQGMFVEPAQPMLQLAKALPAREMLVDEAEMGWLVRQVEETAGESLFEEISRQNQEVLGLLHELRLCRATSGENGENLRSPHAA